MKGGHTGLGDLRLLQWTAALKSTTAGFGNLFFFFFFFFGLAVQFDLPCESVFLLDAKTTFRNLQGFQGYRDFQLYQPWLSQHSAWDWVANWSLLYQPDLLNSQYCAATQNWVFSFCIILWCHFSCIIVKEYSKHTVVLLFMWK